ncbi:ATP-dependent Clp protease ATP-binding subunit [Patescibacteria group bacterium]|nr:ATP-dependent Clp protease ATP-binding subunit [Patescibacteria group bacterium]MBP9709992.1 ATP-dependent Clp protease ATP-binding subunit [Patescibacteria group bacterium]
MAPSSAVQTCRECLGDPRAALRCAACKGAGVFYPDEDGVLLWRPTLDGFFFAFRRWRLTFHRGVQLGFLLLIFLCFAGWGWHWFTQGDPLQLFEGATWVSGHWSMMLWWIGCLAICFLVFHVQAFAEKALIISSWSASGRARKTDANQLVDVSAYAQPALWSVLEQAYQLAVQTGRAEVLPLHVFAASLSSPAGGIFLTRLGVANEVIKPPLVELLRSLRSGTPTVLSSETKTVLLSAYIMAREARRKYMGVTEVFVQAFLADETLQAMFDRLGFPREHVLHVAHWVRLQEQLREEHDRFISLSQQKPNTGMNRLMTARQTALLDRFSEDLTLAARNGHLMPPVGREKEMEELLRAIESGRQGVVLVGDAGVGKTALVEGLARRMVEEDVPSSLFDRRLVSVHLAALVAGGESGQALERLLTMLNEAALSGNIVLVLEGIEALAGGGTGAMDLAEALASELDRGHFFVIATTTPQAWTGVLERRSLGSKLVRVQVEEMNEEAVLEVLMAKSGFIEYETRVFFSYAALERAVTLGTRYLHDERMPQAAINMVREAAVLARNERGEQVLVSAEDVAKIIQAKTNIPVNAISQDESQKLLNLEERLHGRVIGQEEAVTAVAQAMRRARADVREHKRPIANFLFLGPTGVGKTELSKALAAEYFGREEAMIRLDMSEYQHPSSIVRMIGSPGDERGGLLTEAVRKQPFSIILLDELEKAHPDILTLFLQVMDDGRLTDGVGRTVDFTNAVLIATSNAGTSFIQEQVKVGASTERIKTGLLEGELKGVFRPEFLNRFDGVIVFKPLTLENVRAIAGLLLHSLAKRLALKGMGFRAEPAAVEELVQAGFDPLYGARPLRRVIQERVENALADALLRKDVSRRDTIVIQPGGKLEVEHGTFVPE